MFLYFYTIFCYKTKKYRTDFKKINTVAALKKKKAFKVDNLLQIYY